MKMGIGGKILLFGLLAGGVVFCSGAERYVARDASHSFRDPYTGRTLPPQLGGFCKKEARFNRNPVVGSMVLYVPEKSPESTASVYFYALSEQPEPITEKLYRQHVEFVRNSLLEKLLENKRITGLKFIPGTLSYEKKGLSCTGEFFFELSGRRISTGIFMMPCGKFMIKVLLTRPTADPEQKKASLHFIRMIERLFISPVNPKRKHKVPSNGK